MLVNKPISWLFILLNISLFLTLQACTIRHTQQMVYNTLHEVELIDHHRIERVNQWVLTRQASIYLARPQWLVHKENTKSLPRTFKQLTERFYFHVKRSFPQTELALSQGAIDDARLAALKSGHNILIYPQVMLIKDQLSAWEEIHEDWLIDVDKTIGRDQVVLQVLVYDIHKNQLIDSTNILSHSGLLSVSQGMPEDLFDRGIADYVHRLSGRHPPLARVD